jgi:hypothetical protein
VERTVIEALKRQARAFNNRRPEVICVAYEHDPRDGALADVAAARRGSPGPGPGGRDQQQQPRRGQVGARS